LCISALLGRVRVRVRVRVKVRVRVRVRVSGVPPRQALRKLGGRLVRVRVRVRARARVRVRVRVRAGLRLRLRLKVRGRVRVRVRVRVRLGARLLQRLPRLTAPEHERRRLGGHQEDLVGCELSKARLTRVSKAHMREQHACLPGVLLV
jgi:hypothetical protein